MRLNRFITFLLVLFPFITLFFIETPKMIGMSVQSFNGDELVQGGTSVWAISVSVYLLLILILVIDEKEINITKNIPKTFRRLSALFIDFIIGMFLITGIIGLIPAIYESMRTQNIVLNFERDSIFFFDWILSTFLFLLMNFLLLAYLVFPIIKNQQTIGLYLTGMKIVTINNTSPSIKHAILRWIFVLFALSAFPITLLIGKNEMGLYWHERYSRTKIVLTDQVN